MPPKKSKEQIRKERLKNLAKARKVKAAMRTPRKLSRPRASRPRAVINLVVPRKVSAIRRPRKALQSGAFHKPTMSRQDVI